VIDSHSKIGLYAEFMDSIRDVDDLNETHLKDEHSFGNPIVAVTI